jgi:hypothetical protein
MSFNPEEVSMCPNCRQMTHALPTSSCSKCHRLKDEQLRQNLYEEAARRATEEMRGRRIDLNHNGDGHN